jgi:hypothetical protein
MKGMDFIMLLFCDIQSLLVYRHSYDQDSDDDPFMDFPLMHSRNIPVGCTKLSIEYDKSSLVIVVASNAYTAPRNFLCRLQLIKMALCLSE